MGEAHRLPRRQTHEKLLTRGECGCLDITLISLISYSSSPLRGILFALFTIPGTGSVQAYSKCPINAPGVEEIWLQIRALQGACWICRSLGCVPGLRVQVSAWQSRHLEHPLGSAALRRGKDRSAWGSSSEQPPRVRTEVPWTGHFHPQQHCLVRHRSDHRERAD